MGFQELAQSQNKFYDPQKYNSFSSLNFQKQEQQLDEDYNQTLKMQEQSQIQPDNSNKYINSQNLHETQKLQQIQKAQQEQYQQFQTLQQTFENFQYLQTFGTFQNDMLQQQQIQKMYDMMQNLMQENKKLKENQEAYYMALNRELSTGLRFFGKKTYDKSMETEYQHKYGTFQGYSPYYIADDKQDFQQSQRKFGNLKNLESKEFQKATQDIYRSLNEGYYVDDQSGNEKSDQLQQKSRVKQNLKQKQEIKEQKQNYQKLEEVGKQEYGRNDEEEKKYLKQQRVKQNLQSKRDLLNSELLSDPNNNNQIIYQEFKEKKPLYLSENIGNFNQPLSNNPGKEDFIVNEFIQKRKQFMSIQQQIEKILGQTTGTHGRRCQNQYLQEQLEFLEKERDQITNYFEKEEKRENMLIKYLSENGGDVNAYQQLMHSRKARIDLEWQNYLNRFSEKNHKERMNRDWTKSFKLPLSHRNEMYKDQYAPYPSDQIRKQEYQDHLRKLELIYNAQPQFYYTGNQAENKKSRAASQLKKQKELEQKYKFKNRNKSLSNIQNSAINKSQSKSKIKKFNQTVSFQLNVKKKSGSNENNQNQSQSLIQNTSQNYKQKLNQTNNNSQVDKQLQKSNQSQNQDQILENTINKSMQKSFDTENVHFSRCIEPHLQNSQNYSLNISKSAELKKNIMEQSRKQQDQYLYNLGQNHYLEGETDYLAKNIQQKIEDLKELKNLIKNSINPKIYDIVDEKVELQFKEANLRCKGCVKAKLAQAIKSLTDRQHAQMLIASEQVKNKEKIMRMQKKINAGQELLSQKQLKDLKKKWIKFEKQVIQNNELTQKIEKKLFEKQREEFESKNCPSCMRISILPKLEKQFDENQYKNDANMDEDKIDKLRQRHNANLQVENQVLRQNFIKNFDESDFEYKDFVQKLVAKLRKQLQNKTKQNQMQKDFIAHNRDRMATQSVYAKEKSVYAEKEVDLFKKYKYLQQTDKQNSDQEDQINI
ncbi:hypothetical protein PPERSA_03892 [Pseudocohnilembus persalinus]|uniref:Uncharacterized protein n=1 Tax=Pseudocohnilembus persalinus TaxID=266149 RepID=A0A0V0Q9B4_PSEPJ|nr:hypothetical protein PPERSA_03892 [Pseudocohnilembus persalinus]|eukprot:KRW98757.1 hypothetical protein PPERSA_03892 [Pseudocohnilembus persalinus]